MAAMTMPLTPPAVMLAYNRACEFSAVDIDFLDRHTSSSDALPLQYIAPSPPHCTAAANPNNNGETLRNKPDTRPTTNPVLAIFAIDVRNSIYSWGII